MYPTGNDTEHTDKASTEKKSSQELIATSLMVFFNSLSHSYFDVFPLCKITV